MKNFTNTALNIIKNIKNNNNFNTFRNFQNLYENVSNSTNILTGIAFENHHNSQHHNTIDNSLRLIE